GLPGGLAIPRCRAATLDPGLLPPLPGRHARNRVRLVRGIRCAVTSVSPLALVACTRPGPATTSGSQAPATPLPSVTRSSSPAPAQSPAARGALVLTADLSERPAVWHRVAFIPFGRDESRLGHELPPVH